MDLNKMEVGQTIVEAAPTVKFQYTGGPDGVDFELTIDGKKHILTIVEAKALYQDVHYALYTFKKKNGK